MKVLQIVALLALASQAMAQGWCAAPTLKCLSAGHWTSSLAVEVSLAHIASTVTTRYQKFDIQAHTDKGSFCKATITPCPGQETVAFWFGPAHKHVSIAPWTVHVVEGDCAREVPCGTQFVITVKNSDGQMSITTCYSSACPAVSSPPPAVCSPPPVAVHSPPVCSPPPYVCSPPPVTVHSPPPYVCSPPPYVCSPPPVKVYSPPCVASPPPYVCSPPPVKVYSPPCVTVSSPPPKCQHCSPAVTIAKPPPKYCAPPVYGPQCGVTKWGKPVYCKKGKKCCTVTVKKWYGKHCKTYTKQECMKKCPKH